MVEPPDQQPVTTRTVGTCAIADLLAAVEDLLIPYQALPDADREQRSLHDGDARPIAEDRLGAR
jgi:hypothetical protein